MILSSEEKEDIIKTWLWCYERGIHNLYEEVLCRLLTMDIKNDNNSNRSDK